jgi:hypothetical protein
VSSIIGGIIILTLILTALTEMVFIAQQYDAYENIANVMSQKDIDRSAEDLIAVYPGIVGPQLVDSSGQPQSDCGMSTCYNRYDISLTNLGGIGIQVERIYINSTSVCDNLCILNPNNQTSSKPANLAFDSSESFINPAEAGHILSFWMNQAMNLPTDSFKANTISIVTARGRTFAFQWPFPPAGEYVPTDFHLDMGPIRITYDPNLITFTTNSSQYTTFPGPGSDGCANDYPSATSCLPGPPSSGWGIPFPAVRIVFYLRISNVGSDTVTLLDRSYILAQTWDEAGIPWAQRFYIVEPMPKDCWSTYFDSSYFNNNTWPTEGGCPRYGSYALQPYNATGGSCTTHPCYQLPPGPSLGIPGRPVYVLFSATAPRQITVTPNALWPSADYVLFLQLYYLYLGYEYSLTIPLISITTE